MYPKTAIIVRDDDMCRHEQQNADSAALRLVAPLQAYSKASSLNATVPMSSFSSKTLQRIATAMSQALQSDPASSLFSRSTMLLGVLLQSLRSTSVLHGESGSAFSTGLLHAT